MLWTDDFMHAVGRTALRALRLGAACLAFIAVLGHAQETASSDQAADPARLVEERARRIREIGEERALIQEQQARESAQCYQRFIVNSCVQAAADRHRKSLTALRREETAINNAEREREGREQRTRIAGQEQADRDKKVEAAARGSEVPSLAQRQQVSEDKLRQQEAERPIRAQQGVAQQQRRDAERAEAQQQRAQKAAEAPAQASRFEARQREAQARREERNRRLQERAAKSASGRPAPQALPAQSNATPAP
jgi:hypothetical protein